MSVGEEDEVTRLRRAVRDLVALTGLPAVWAGYDTPRIAVELADVLLRTLGLDFVYVALAGSAAVARAADPAAPGDLADRVGAAAGPWLGQAEVAIAGAIPDPAGNGMTPAFLVPLGYGRSCGTLLAGARRADFPTETERLLLTVAANQAAVIIQLKQAEAGRGRVEAALQEQERRKEEFLAILAHELRNPLAPITNALHLMRLAPGNGEVMELSRHLIERQAQQMIRLVDDLLDVSRITRGTITLKKERVELAAVVRDGVETTRPLIESCGHELKVRLPVEPVWLHADPARLTQVVANLLNNAAKYTRPGGHIALSAAAEPGAGTSPPAVIIRVEDDGVGIPPEQLAEVFEMFARVGATEGGLGVGLSLVRALVQMHGGAVEARSAGAGRGSEFVVRLPAALPEPAGGDRPCPAETRPRAGRYRILVVDDNVDAAESLALILRMRGNDVCVAHTGPAGLEAAQHFHPDAVLLDIGLPGMNGYEGRDAAAGRRAALAPWR